MQPTFYTDNIHQFCEKLTSLDTDNKNKTLRKVLKFLKRITVPYQRVSDVFLDHNIQDIITLDASFNNHTIGDKSKRFLENALLELYDYKEPIHTPDDLPAQVLNFIKEFTEHTVYQPNIPNADKRTPEIIEDILYDQFACGYCYHFAYMLQATFHRGEIVWTAPFGHIAWQDIDGHVYDINGTYTGEAEYFIPIRYIQTYISDFTHENGIDQCSCQTSNDIDNAIMHYLTDHPEQKNESIDFTNIPSPNAILPDNIELESGLYTLMYHILPFVKSPEYAAPAINHLLACMQSTPVNLAARIPTHIQPAVYHTEWDDGSHFQSNCIVNTKERNFVAIDSAGTPNDCAAWTKQYIAFSDGTTFSVYDPEWEDDIPNGIYYTLDL